MVLAGRLLLTSLSAFSIDVLACRPQFQSVAEIVQQSSSIFTATVIARHPMDGPVSLLELRVAEVLKGSAPTTLRVKENWLIHPNEYCLAIEEGSAVPQVTIGERWIISGGADAAGDFAPTIGDSFRISKSDGISSEVGEELLNDFRKEILRLRKRGEGKVE